MEHGPFEDVFPIKNGEIPASYVSLPEGNQPGFNWNVMFGFGSRYSTGPQSKQGLPPSKFRWFFRSPRDPVIQNANAKGGGLETCWVCFRVSLLARFFPVT